MYKLLACDLDETTLTSDLRLTETTADAMQQAIEEGKHVVFSTGRSMLLTKPYVDQVPGLRYVLTGTGATGTDLLEKKELFRTDIDEETIKWIMAAAAGCDLLPFLFIRGDVLCPTWTADRANDFHVGKYADTYRKYLDPVDEPFSVFMENPSPVEKINLLFANTEERDIVYAQIQDLPVSFTTISDYALEINANGVSKAKGLSKLCRYLGIDLAECIAVGDAENDMEMLRKSGLGLAVDNAGDLVKTAADAVVPSNNEDGVAYAIRRYLLEG